MDDSTPSSFAKAAEFLTGSQELTQHADYAVPTTAEEDRRENDVLDRLTAILDEYQEQPHLLDPALESLVSPLLLVLRDQIRRPDPPLVSKRLHRLARLIYFLTKVRGSKVIVRFFPHETSDLSLLIPLLSTSSIASPNPFSSSLTSASWELRYVLLLWLSVAIRQPFDLSRLQAQTGERIEQIGYEALRSASKEGDGAVEMLARFYSRRDAPLENLFKACEEVFSTEEDSTLITAHLSLLSSVLRNASPALLLAHWSQLYHLLAFLPTEPQKGKGGALMSKMRCKVAGRLALLRLIEAKEAGADEDEVPEEVEAVVGELIEGLGHSDTIPRYSSAKYLSRLCENLPSSFASQIVDAVLSNLEEALVEANEQGLADRAEGKVQGACLACGEMARRGLLGRGEDAEEQIRRVVDGVLQALAFDHLHLFRTLGTSARDSAAYVLWSLSRTLPASLARPYAQRIAEGLVCTALFDREVQVRRAASAAFQEGVGRWSIFPHGIDVLREVDFFTVSVRHRAYLQAAPSVASHSEYRSSILSHLVDTGLSHYDADLRTLSAKALGSVVALDAASLAPDLVVQQINKLGRTKDAAKLHGLLLSLAALAESISSLPSEHLDGPRNQIFLSIVSILVPCARQLKSSPITLADALTALAASAPSPSPSAVVPPEWFDLVLKACETINEEVHARAGEAVEAVSSAIECGKELDHRNGTRQQVAVLLLGKVNFGLIDDLKLLKVVERLQLFVQREGSRQASTIEGRRNGVESLAALLRSYYTVAALDPVLPSALDALLLGFSDYTTDQRGDVGSWVRVVTLTAWSTLLPALLSPTPSASSTSAPLDQLLIDGVISSMAKQAVERLDNVREVAGQALVAVWEGAGEKAMRMPEVWEGIVIEERQSWRELTWSSERILPLLEVLEYRSEILEGAVLAASQYSSSTPFLDYALLLPPLPSSESVPSPFSLLDLLRALHTLAKTNFGSNRLFIPFLHSIAAFAEAGCLDEIALDGEGKGEAVLKLLLAVAMNGVGKMRSPQRLGASSKLLIAFLALPRIGSLAAEKIPTFLAHSQPWLRLQFADDLFGQVGTLALESGEEELETLLTETAWNADVNEGAARQAGRLLKDALSAREEQ